MRAYRAKRDSKPRVTDKYTILGFISSGTYGRVYKAQSRDAEGRIHAIKKFKPDKEGEQVSYTGISQSAIREMALCTELAHPNVVHTVEIILEDKCIYIVFEYAEHDPLQIVHHHNQPQHTSLPIHKLSFENTPIQDTSSNVSHRFWILSIPCSEILLYCVSAPSRRTYIHSCWRI